ncbi:amidohydrolase [Salimicrobium sp. PL1-032A]|uniref:amidohydrolase n=1 Tax=Salimicrobium sp. PL1-032A TaxID=3095364 RepID=UPI0032611C92
MDIWFGGKIYTMVEEGAWEEAVVVEDGMIIDTGSTHTLYSRYEDRIEEEHNLNGAVMYPGFTDSHLHMIMHGERLLRLDLSFMKSKQEVLQALKQRAGSTPAGEWVIGEGFNENQWKEKTPLHKAELDEVSTEHPIMLSRICRHALVANSKAIDLAGVDKTTPDPQGGKVEKDEKGLNGLFHDEAQDYIKKAMPEVSSAYLEEALTQAVEDMYSRGLVGGHTEDLYYYGGFRKTLDAFHRVIDGTKRKFRANLLVHHKAIDEMEASGLSFGDGTAYVELGAMKIFSDGALGGRTAWLTAPYEDDPSQEGMMIHSGKDLDHLFEKARQKRMPVAVHAIGDGAVEAVVERMERYPVEQGGRDRIIHAQILNDGLMERLKKLPVVLDIQPSFVASDFPWVIDRLGEDRLKKSYAWKTLYDKGILLAGGSDAPIEEVNPLMGIRAAVDRRATEDYKVYQEEERLSMYEAVSLYTKGSALATGKEKEQGMIREGYLADFTILDRDLFSLAPYEVSDAVVLMTVVDGEIMYEKGVTSPVSFAGYDISNH